MWIVTNFGFFSVVQKSQQQGNGMLTVRARAKSDLELLREKYLSGLGPIEADTGTDYKYRAVAPAAQVAAAFCKAVADIDYSNFKSSVAARQGHDRSDLYHELWTTLWKLKDQDKPAPVAATTQPKEKGAEKASKFGGVVFNDDGKLLLRNPTNNYGGYAWTYAKGKPNRGESPEQAALREVLEETGIKAEIIGRIPGNFRGDTSYTAFFLMRCIKDTGKFDEETEEIIWVTPEEAGERINETRSVNGLRRDLEVLEAAVEYRKQIANDR